ncbi:hypothetical protein J4Q44_G00386830, partial [Coregonus suidteri]
IQRDVIISAADRRLVETEGGSRCSGRCGKEKRKPGGDGGRIGLLWTVWEGEEKAWWRRREDRAALNGVGRRRESLVETEGGSRCSERCGKEKRKPGGDGGRIALLWTVWEGEEKAWWRRREDRAALDGVGRRRESLVETEGGSRCSERCGKEKRKPGGDGGRIALLWTVWEGEEKAWWRRREDRAALDGVGRRRESLVETEGGSRCSGRCGKEKRKPGGDGGRIALLWTVWEGEEKAWWRRREDRAALDGVEGEEKAWWRRREDRAALDGVGRRRESLVETEGGSRCSGRCGKEKRSQSKPETFLSKTAVLLQPSRDAQRSPVDYFNTWERGHYMQRFTRLMEAFCFTCPPTVHELSAASGCNCLGFGSSSLRWISPFFLSVHAV